MYILYGLLTWAPTGMGRGSHKHMPSPGKDEKCYRVKKLHRRSQFERPGRWFSVKKDREWLFNTDYFICVYYKRILWVVGLIFWRRTTGRRTRPPWFGIWKPMLTVPRFYHIHRRSGAKILAAASGHLEVKNCTKIYLRSLRGLTAPSSRTPPRIDPLGFRSPFALPWKKILRAPMSANEEVP